LVMRKRSGKQRLLAAFQSAWTAITTRP